jgi:hypothetical protein
LLVHDAIMQDITRKAVRPSDSEEHVKFRSIQADEYIKRIWLAFVTGADQNHPPACFQNTLFFYVAISL